jgi:outer membrane receptor for ferrienterochelin and colicins
MFLRNVRVPALALVALLGSVSSAMAQQVATIRGTVTSAGGGVLSGVTVTLKGTNNSTATNANGKYAIQRVPMGEQVIVFRWLGYAPQEKKVTVTGDMTLDAVMEPQAVSLADLTVSAASREPERIVEAPAAVTAIEPRVLQSISAAGQAPLALAQAPGVDIVQSGVNDFNINARGFNSSLNRRVLTLLDGRDLAIAFLGSQEWNTLPVATDELSSMELVRGPGSALYGANAFAGVVDMRTLSPRESPGGKISLSGGELESIKGDLRWAGLFGQGRWGVRVNAGYASNDTWTRSRTSTNGFDMRREYAGAIDTVAFPIAASREIRPLAGQTSSPGGAATGDRDPITALYGSARLDRYFDNGGVVTVEGGISDVKNETLVTGIGRVQVAHGRKPYGRVAYNSDRINILGFINRRESIDSQYSLASGAGLLEKSDIMHVEAQANERFLDDKLKVVGGASYRQTNVNTFGTLMGLENDDRSDATYSAYGQLEYELNSKLRLVGAARYDEGDLFEGQFSPKLGIVYSPDPNHGFRVTYNRAFQTPNYSEFFLKAAAGAPANLSLLEAGLRANAQLGPALAGVPQGQLFTNSAVVPVQARGNADLTVEKVTGYEVGYKGALNEKVYLTVDVYYNNIKDFVTDLLPGVNTTFGAWTAPAAVPAQARATLESTVRTQLLASPATRLAGLGLTRVENGQTAVVLSYTNAGEVSQTGFDVGLGYQLSPAFRVDGSFSYFSFNVKSQQSGDQLLPNTPDRKATLTLSYEGGENGFDASISGRFVAAYNWAAGVFVGRVPESQFINANVGYQVTPRYRLFALATNLFDQQRYQMLGGAVIGRRVMGGLSATF